MALLLESHYSKDEILETYLNEIFLGRTPRARYTALVWQSFLFDRPLDRLELHEIATLVGMVKGPGVYDRALNPTTR